MSEFPTSQSRICSIVCGATPVASIRGLFNDLPRRIVLYLQGLWGPVSISATGTGHSPWQLQCGWLIIAGMKFLRPDLADQASERARIIQVVVARGHCDVVWARNIPDGIKAARDDAEMEPVLGFEPRTDGLQNRCSTTELNWHDALICACLKPCFDRSKPNYRTTRQAAKAPVQNRIGARMVMTKSL